MKINTQIKVGICDDEKSVHEEVTRLIHNYCIKNNISIELVYFETAQKLIDSDIVLDLLLLDIEMDKLDGIEAAYKLRNRGMDYKIVMLSAREDRYREAFRIGAFRFVPKPIDQDEFFKAIDDVFEHMIGLERVSVFRDNIPFNIMQKDIVYIEANRSSTLIYTHTMDYRSEESLNSWMKLLDNRIFFRCHKSYIVNMGKIENIEKDIVLLVTGDKVKISRRLKTPLINAYMEYDTNHR